MREEVVIRENVTIKCISKFVGTKFEKEVITNIETFIDSVERVIVSKFKSDFKLVEHEYEDDTLCLYYEVDMDAIHTHTNATNFEPADDEFEFSEDLSKIAKILNNAFVGIKFLVYEDDMFQLVA